MDFAHVSVLLKECIDWLVTDRDGIYLDCTLGGAGHSAAIAARLSEKGRLVGIDQDEDALAAASERLKNARCRVDIVKSNFKDLTDVLDRLDITEVTGILFDLGVSSYQLDTPERGFSYMHEGPLDMRMNRDAVLTADTVVNTYSEAELAGLIWRYGEERWAKRIAQFIVAERRKKPLRTTGELVEVIKKAIPKGARKDGPHPAKRTFQALRIEVNDELNILDRVVEDAVNSLRSGGRIGIITFQSLEDRIVKQKLAQLAKGCICPPHMPCVCGRKPLIRKLGSLVPDAGEIEANPRARSARLRFAEKLQVPQE
ncbi:MAG: 16S rRNA (cytosine(1402)-N(4))-methyltransferase RsmH [Acidaminococcaceae bacterium]|nr:16S rRNA (cytosine(1402)-N(4))-methyltransferase RsmH [Acidaminococcaceae bacterium]